MVMHAPLSHADIEVRSATSGRPLSGHAPHRFRLVDIDGATTGKKYQVAEGFFRRPHLMPFVEVADVDVDRDDNVYVLTRSPRAVMIFDKDGAFLHSWGEIRQGAFDDRGGFGIPHGITVGPDGYIYTTDEGTHVVRKWTTEGRVLMTIGSEHINALKLSGIPFFSPTEAAIAEDGDIYVSDGYGNAHVHCFDGSGSWKFTFGGDGSEPGKFKLPHGLYLDERDQQLYVADRLNNRVQIFSRKGEFIKEWADLRLPNSIRRLPDGNFAIAELGHRVSVLDPKGAVISRWGDDVKESDVPAMGGRGRKVMFEPGLGQFCAPHGLGVDSKGGIYVTDVAETYARLDRGDRSIQKFVPA